MLIDARRLFPKAVDDPDEEITVTMTKGRALALMDAVWAYTTDYELPESDDVLLEDAYMDLQCEIWPEIDTTPDIDDTE